MASISVLTHKPTLVVVQMWHALGAIKRFGLAALDTPEGRPSGLATAMRMHQGYDWVIAGGPRMVEPFAAAFGVDAAQVVPIGTPRVDLLRDPANLETKRARIRAAHPRLGTRPLALYAPTFRTDEPVRVAEALDALAGEDVEVVVALHPLDHRDFTDRPGVVQDGRFSTLDWLTVADLVITDYSAIAFDAAVLGLPMYFYAYDLDEYRERRGLFLDYEKEMPGPVCRDAAELAVAIRSGAGSRDRVESFCAEFVAPPGRPCTSRLVSLALGGRPEEAAA
jgi:CDP-glycerol glycerophosphotransferase (TagB/SpsB family)